MDTVEKKRKKYGKRLRTLENLHQDGNHPVPATPLHAEAEGSLDADCGKSAPQRLDVHSYQPDSAVASGHSSLTGSRAFMDSIRQVRQIQTLDDHPFLGSSAEWSFSDRPPDAPGATVDISHAPARELAGSFRTSGSTTSVVDANPRSTGTSYQTRRNSATPDNGSHDYSAQNGATSRNPVSSKAAALQAIKEEMRAKGYTR